MTQQALADSIQVPQGTIARLETGTLFPSQDLLTKLSLALGINPSFLKSESDATLSEGSLGLFRLGRKKSVSAADIDTARANGSMVIAVFDHLSTSFTKRPSQLPSFKGMDVVQAALHFRNWLKLAPNDPVGPLMKSVERAGVLVSNLPVEIPNIDGFAANVGSQYSAVFISSDITLFRQRLTLLHEVGHIVLGHHAPGRQQDELEIEAFRFACEVLLPTIHLETYAGKVLSLDTCLDLKKKFGISVQATVTHAFRSGFISDNQRKHLYAGITRRGWKVVEPGDELSVTEKPGLLREMARKVYGNPIDYEQMSRHIGLKKAELECIVEMNSFQHIAHQQDGDLLVLPGFESIH